MADIRALIVDDEPLARRGIRQLLVPYPDIVVVGECRDGREALKALAAAAPDLVFLDVQMPGLDGLGVIRAYGAERMPLTVFVTAHDEFAVRAFEARALDYLVKPLSEARFRATVLRVRERVRQGDAAARAARLRGLLADDAAPGAGRIAVATETGQRLVDVDEIDWIEADDYYARVHANGRDYRVRESLAAFEARLNPQQFVRIHRSVIVRVDRIREVNGDGVTLRDGTRLEVSRRRLPEVRALLRPFARRSLQ